MIIKNKLLLYILFSSASLLAQIENDSIDKIKIIPKISVLDSLKATFVKHSAMSQIDGLWIKELSNNELSNTQFADILNINPDENVVYDLPTDVLKERLAKLDAKSPFNIEYNIGLENVIKSLLKNRKRSYERLLSISQYYFPLFEEALSKYNIPIEVKYLAIVESALNTKAKSRVGAMGLWQFMYNTGLQYKLDVNSYVDERCDPIKATEAACQYLSGMYKIFGDWDLVLASYNCGPGNVTKAIRRSNGQTNYWNIRKKLPRETAGYLPAFLATMYIMEYHKEHGINKLKAPVNYFATDTIAVKKQLSFKQISQLTDIPETELQFFNPSYKLDIIPAANKLNYIRLPQEKVAVFTSNEDKIYFYANYEANLREKPNAEPIAVKDTLNYYTNDRKLVTKFKSYKVKRGDSLNEIAGKFGVTVSDIKSWNKLKSENAPKGKILKLETSEYITVRTKHAIKKDAAIAATEIKKDSVVSAVANEQIAVKKDTIAEVVVTNEKPKTEAKIDVPVVVPAIKTIVVAKTEIKPIKEVAVYKEEKITTFKEVTKIYKVKKGDNLSSIADDLGVTIADLKSWNKIKKNSVNKGANLKYTTSVKSIITVKKKVGAELAKDAIAEAKSKNIDAVANDEYTFAKGDNLKSIAAKNNVSVKNLQEWNNLKSIKVKIGTKLVLSNPERIETKSSNSHKVAQGENIWTIAEKYKVTAVNLREWNNLKSNEIKKGQILIVSNDEISTTKNKKAAENKEIAKMYLVKKGDSLFSISQKYPGVTVSDIKKWNDIQDGNIRPGMKLKIII